MREKQVAACNPIESLFLDGPSPGALRAYGVLGTYHFGLRYWRENDPKKKSADVTAALVEFKL